MTAGKRIAAASIAACLACMLLFFSAVSAPAAGPPIESYRASGEARGLDVGFSFQGSLFERLVDLGLPSARSDLSSEAGGAASGVAAQIYPGDLIVGAAGEQLPFYRQARYPHTVDDPEPIDEAHTTDVFRLPGVINAGPLLAIENSYLKATASEKESSGQVITNRVSLGMELPLITVKHLETTSMSTRSVDRVVHTARSIARDISIQVSETLSIAIGAVISEVKTSSDGASPTAESKLTVSGVTVRMSDVTYGATIDQGGIHLEGAAEPVPSVIPQNLSQVLNLTLTNAGIKIATAETAEKLEDVTGEATIGGLLITVTGKVPFVYTPQLVNVLIEQQIKPILPAEVQKLVFSSTCLKEDVLPLLPEQLTSNLPDLPLCLSPNVVPGPGSGAVATFAIGPVESMSAAVQSVPFTEGPIDGGTDGGFPTGPGGGLPPIGGGLPGGPQPAPPPGGPQPQQGIAYGLVARMPSEAILGVGIGFLVVAIGVSFGPSLRPWRRPTP